MSEFYGTKGKCVVEFNHKPKRTRLEVNIYPYENRPDFKENIYSYMLDEDQCSADGCGCVLEEKSNAELIADSFNTISECGLKPGELLKQYNDLLETQKLQIFDAVKYTLEQCDTPRKGSLNDFFEEIYNKVKTT